MANEPQLYTELESLGVLSYMHFRNRCTNSVTPENLALDSSLTHDQVGKKKLLRRHLAVAKTVL